jgi:hypothetical protein
VADTVCRCFQMSSLQYSQGLGVTLDLLKNRAEDVLIASLHAYRNFQIFHE